MRDKLSPEEGRVCALQTAGGIARNHGGNVTQETFSRMMKRVIPPGVAVGPTERTESGLNVCSDASPHLAQSFTTQSCRRNMSGVRGRACLFHLRSTLSPRTPMYLGSSERYPAELYEAVTDRRCRDGHGHFSDPRCHVQPALRFWTSHKQSVSSNVKPCCYDSEAP